MVIRIYKDSDCIRYITVDADVALSLFNMVLLSLGEGESVVLYSGDNREHVVATGC